MELNKENIRKIDVLFEDFQLRLRDETDADPDDFILVQKNKDAPKEEVGLKPFSEVTFGTGGVGVKSNESVEVTAGAMTKLLKHFGKSIPGYIG